MCKAKRLHRMKKTSLIIATTLAIMATPVCADSLVRATEARVVELRAQYSKALRSNDDVTIATARAKLKAAQATAWAARHPAPRPSSVAAR